MPCQCTEVSVGSWLSTRIRNRSPAVARISGPGAVSPNAHVSTVVPPRSSEVALAVSWCSTTRWPGSGRSRAGVASVDGTASVGFEHAAKAPVPATASPPRSRPRREISCMIPSKSPPDSSWKPEYYTDHRDSLDSTSDPYLVKI
jgi:hypothetical protein